MPQVKDPRSGAPAARRLGRRVHATTTIDVTGALAELARNGGPVYIRSGDGRPLAALISVEHARAIEDFEARRDARLAAKARAEFLTSGGKTVPWEEVKAKAGF